MKKIFTILAAAVAAALCITSCNKVSVDTVMPEDTFSVTDMVIDITVGGFNGADTKAVKSSWNSGDQINIWYDTHFTKNPDLVLVYDGAKWSVDAKASVSGAAPKASGTLNALYVEGGLSVLGDYEELTYDDDDWCSFSIFEPEFTIDGQTPAPGMPLYTYMSEVNYTFSSNKLTAVLDKWLFSYANNIQIVITGLPSGYWALKCDKFFVASSFELYNGYVSGSTRSRGTYTLPLTNKDGMAYMFSCIGKNQDLNFTLANTGKPDEKYTFSTTGKSFDGDRLQSFKIPFSKFKPVPNDNGQDYVDLGLSVKWAKNNLGASKPESYGLYYQWGDTKGYVSNTSDGKYFDWKDHDGNVTYKWCNGSYDSLTKYNTDSSYGTVDNKTVLDMEDDAARAALGGNWRMPTDAEWTELRENCTWTWTSNYNGTAGVAGMIVTSKKSGYTNKSIFLPAAGYRRYDNRVNAGSCGYYWSSSISTGNPSYAWGVYFNSYNVGRNSYYRYSGLSVRPVSD